MTGASSPAAAGGAQARDAILPGQWRPWAFDAFAWYSRRLVRRRFHAMRLAEDACPAGLDADARPLLVALSHSSWWDPIAAVLLKQELFPSRSSCSPMDRAQLERFGLLRSLGIFGIDPDDPQAMGPMVTYIEERMREHPRPTLIITPQGRFADPRSPLEVRPGLAMVAARLSRMGAVPRVIAMSLEYTFWIDQRPELLARVCDVPGPASPQRATAWQRQIEAGMASNAAALCRFAMARSGDGMRTLIGARSGAVHPVFDAWARLRGRSTSIDLSGRRPPDAAVGSRPRAPDGAAPHHGTSHPGVPAAGGGE